MEDTTKSSGDGHSSGVHATQPECRTSLPPVDNNVGAAKEVKGKTLECVRQQTGENRYPINNYDYEKSSHGPNN